MDVPFLEAKINIPPLQLNHVFRPRLIQSLELSLEGKLTLIAAPAGFGKTSFVCSWISGIEHPVAWVSLDEADNDPVLFWGYIVYSLQKMGEGNLRPVLPLLDHLQLPPVDRLLITLANELAAEEGKIFLVLDDYHVIHNQAIHEGLRFLIENQPQQLHIILSTRADPPLPIARLRGRGQLVEIRAEDLRFNSQEAASYLNDKMALDLEAGDIDALESRTEGWIVGLQLAALSMRARDDRRKFISTFSGGHHFILEYLVEEVLSDQPDDLRRFLLQTSILEQLTGSLCDFVTQGSGGAGLLAQLHRENLFLIPLDDERSWYRYHHLFAEMLQDLLRVEFSPQEVNRLYRRAGEWFARDGSLEEGIRYTLRAGDLESAASLVEQSAPAALYQGRLRTLLAWCEALPDSLLDSRPRLRVHQAWALHLSGESRAAERLLEDTRKSLESSSSSPQLKSIRGEIAATLAAIATAFEDMPRVIQETQEALTSLPEDNLAMRARSHLALGTAYAYQDELQAAVENWMSAREMALGAANPFLAAAAGELLAGTQIYHQGRLQEGADLLERIIHSGTLDDGSVLPFTATAHALLGEVYLEWDDLDTSASYLRKSIDLMNRSGIAYGRAHTCCALGRLRQAQGDASGAESALLEAERALDERSFLHQVIHVMAYQVRYWLWLGDVERAAHWASGDPQLIRRELPGNLPVYLNEIQVISLARIELRKGNADGALVLLDEIQSGAEKDGRLSRLLEIYLYRALALLIKGDTRAAQESFDQCLALAVPHGHIRLFLEAGESVEKLLPGAVSKGIPPVYIQSLVRAFDLSEQDGVAAGKSSGLVESLTPREIEVLQLISQGYSNQDIADTLVVSINTIKKHTSNIYAKLEVRNRAQAIIRAAELGLI